MILRFATISQYLRCPYISVLCAEIITSGMSINEVINEYPSSLRKWFLRQWL